LVLPDQFTGLFFRQGAKVFPGSKKEIMRSLFEETELRSIADEFIKQVVFAVKNKQVRRRSRKAGKGIFYAPVDASGRLADSVHSEMTEDGIQVLCNDYIDKLIFGQPPGEAPGVLEIEQWIADKGLGGELTAQGVAKQIYMFGNSIWAEHDGKDSGLLEDVDISDQLDRLEQKLTTHYADIVATQIMEQFKLAA
jgi:hypothetical protein